MYTLVSISWLDAGQDNVCTLFLNTLSILFDENKIGNFTEQYMTYHWWWSTASFTLVPFWTSSTLAFNKDIIIIQIYLYKLYSIKNQL